VLLYNYDLATVSQTVADKTYLYVAPNLGLVADNALYGSTGPINGGRSSYNGGACLRGRLLHHAAHGLETLHQHPPQLRVRAAPDRGVQLRTGSASVSASAARSPTAARTTAISWAANALLGNLELRFPLIEQLRFGWPGRITLGGINGVLFLDAASSWQKGVKPRFFTKEGGFHADDMLFAWGAGARINLGLLHPPVRLRTRPQLPAPHRSRTNTS